MPPRVPPAWLVVLDTLPLFIQKQSLLIDPFVMETAVPSPISNAFTAPMDRMAFARFASSFSNTGSPMPAGMFFTEHATTPPAESRFSIHVRRYAAAFSDASLSGIPVWLFLASSKSKCSMLTVMSPIA